MLLSSRGEGNAGYFLMADSQTLIEGKVNFKFFHFLCNQRAKFHKPWTAIMYKKAIKVVSWEFFPFPLRGPYYND